MCLFKKEAQNSNCEHSECKTVHLLTKTAQAVGNPGQIPTFMPGFRPSISMNQAMLHQHTISKLIERKQGVPTQCLPMMTEVKLPPPSLFTPQGMRALYGQIPVDNGYNMRDTLNGMIDGRTFSTKSPQDGLSPPNFEDQRTSEGIVNNGIEARMQIMDNSMRELQQKVFSALSLQNSLIAEIKEGNNLLHSRLNQLTNEVGFLKYTSTEFPKNSARKGFNEQGPRDTFPFGEQSTSDPKQNQKIFQDYGVSQSTSSADLLTQIVFGTKSYNYQLKIDSEFPKVVYRERNFGFSVALTDMSGNVIENPNKISLSVALYTCERPPKFIDTNTSGNRILKGQIEKDIVRGKVEFSRLQIREVTSHYRNGWIFLVVFANANKRVAITNRGRDANSEGNPNFVDHNQVMPLVVEKVLVKAKKRKSDEKLIGKKRFSEQISELLYITGDKSPETDN